MENCRFTSSDRRDLSPTIIYSASLVPPAETTANPFYGCDRMRKKNAVCDEICIASYNPKNRTVPDERLEQIFADVGRRYGYENVTARFQPFADFKIRWTRFSKLVDFEISDYLDRAPDDVIEQLADAVFIRISGKQCDYGEAMYRYFEDVRDQNAPDYMERKRLKPTSIGEYHDLNDCVDRLRDQGLIPPDLECILCWDRSFDCKVSGCSVIQRIVTVNTRLDMQGVPEYVLDYAVYSKLAHLMAGHGRASQSEAARLEALYPMRVEAMSWIADHGMTL